MDTLLSLMLLKRNKMRLTKEQRAYINRQLQELYYKKIDLIPIPTTSYGIVNKSDKYPAKVNKAIDVLNTYTTQEKNKYYNAIYPYQKAYNKAKEQLLFSTDYEAVQELINSFKEELK
jgi:hypothetical protein